MEQREMTDEAELNQNASNATGWVASKDMYRPAAVCLRCIEGCFPTGYALGIISFDDHDQAVKCIESRTELREKMWLGGVEMYVVPLCNPVRHIGDYPFFQMDMYDVKNGRNFIKYLNTVEEMIHRKGGLIVAGTTQAGRWRGMRRPYFILLHQWVTVEQLEAYNKEVSPVLRDAGAACSSRVIFEMTTGNVRCFQ
nr:unnamed protein product [Spirometra erinaceieuropaei]